MGRMLTSKDFVKGKVFRIKGRRCEIVHADPFAMKWDFRQVGSTDDLITLTRQQITNISIARKSLRITNGRLSLRPSKS
ncbi:hypothetical protein SAMN05216456_1437 [Devosia crocina]|uniref:Uncharacterized protein n=1 Tax=Devosia crocina TaxID=429728 RepID=A0A1I7NAM1_9HYPH|nr:hypothetical protein SAMN05216456_1437 [Devosia crocina]